MPPFPSREAGAFAQKARFSRVFCKFKNFCLHFCTVRQNFTVPLDKLFPPWYPVTNAMTGNKYGRARPSENRRVVRGGRQSGAEYIPRAAH